MIKRIGVLTLAVFLLLAVLCPGAVQAQGELAILNNSSQAGFPSQLSFNLSAKSNVNITDIRLHYVIERVSLVRVTSEVYIKFAPATLVNVECPLDMRKTGGLPPGSSINYWWTVKDENGSRVETAPEQVQFDDARYLWRSSAENSVTLYWYEGDDSFARELMTATQQALIRLAENTGAHPERPVRIYIYADAQDLQGAMIYPQEWTGGVAFTRYDTVAIGITPANLQWGKRAIAHELTHLIIHQMTLNPYGGLPTWLDEGLAMSTEGELGSQFVSHLGAAVAGNSLISVRSLSSPFSAYADEATLSYAQSYSLVQFLISNYGQSKMLELLLTFKQGSGYDTALGKVYGFDMDGLNALWRDYIAGQHQIAEKAKSGLHPALIGVIAVLASGLLIALGFAVRKRARQRG